MRWLWQNRADTTNCSVMRIAFLTGSACGDMHGAHCLKLYKMSSASATERLMLGWSPFQRKQSAIIESPTQACSASTFTRHNGLSVIVLTRLHLTARSPLHAMSLSRRSLRLLHVKASVASHAPRPTPPTATPVLGCAAPCQWPACLLPATAPVAAPKPSICRQTDDHIH